jgi:hypothetical protein
VDQLTSYSCVILFTSPCASLMAFGQISKLFWLFNILETLILLVIWLCYRKRWHHPWRRSYPMVIGSRRTSLVKLQ